MKLDLVAVRLLFVQVLVRDEWDGMLTCEGVFGERVPFMGIPEYRPVVWLRNVLPQSLRQLHSSDGNSSLQD